MGNRHPERPKRQELMGQRVTLREFRAADASERQAIGRDPEIRLMYGNSDEADPSPLQSARTWLARERQHPCSWAIEFEQQLIGAARLNVSKEDRRARFSIGMYSTEFTDRGLGTEAAILVLDYAFGQLQLHRVDLRVIEYNRRAIRSYEKVGFTVEGRERETVFVNGSWHDDLIMSILDREYRLHHATQV